MIKHKATAARWCKCIDELDKALKPRGAPGWEKSYRAVIEEVTRQ